MTCQSLMSLADTHAAHQSGIEHLSFEDHVHSDDLEHHNDLKSASDSTEKDCHHCCHCHGHASPAICFPAATPTIEKLVLINSAYLGEHKIAPITSLLRPPITKA